MKKLFTLIIAFSLIGSCNFKKDKEPTANNDVKSITIGPDKMIDYKEFDKAKKQCFKESTTYNYYQKCNINIEDKMIRFGSKDAKFKLVWLIKGPQKEFFVEDVKQLANMTSQKSPRANFWRWLVNQNVEVIFVRQAQHKKVAQFKNSDGFIAEFGVNETEETIDDTYEIIQHLKSYGSTVSLLGENYGAMLLYEYILKKGTDEAKHIFINHGKADIKALNYLGEEINPNYETMASHLAAFKAKLIKQGKSQAQIKSAMENEKRWYVGIMSPINKDYTSVLYDVDLSNVSITQSEKDKLVGGVSQKEKDFFKRANATFNYLSQSKIDEYKTNWQKETGIEWAPNKTKDSKVADHFAYLLNKEWFEKNILEKMGWDKEKDGNSDKYHFYSN